MLIRLPNNSTLSLSELLSATLRTDLVPVPATLEITVNGTPEMVKAMVQGTDLVVGESSIKITLVKVQSLRTQMIQGDRAVGGIACVGILTGCLPLIEPLTNAVILFNTTVAEAYRACGCKVAFSKDLPLSKFVCLKGQTPTFEIARRLQEEAAVIRLKDGKLQAIRLDELMKEPAIATYDASAMQRLENPMVESRSLVSFLSVNDDGESIEGDLRDSRPVMFKGGLDSRQLKNLEKVLITRGVVQRPLDNKLQAGQIIKVGDTKLTVLTGAHRVDTGALGGATAMVTKAWLAEVAK